MFTHKHQRSRIQNFPNIISRVFVYNLIPIGSFDISLINYSYLSYLTEDQNKTV